MPSQALRLPQPSAAVMTVAYAATGIAFWAGLIGAGYFASVVGARIYDAHQRGLARVRANRTERHV